VIGREKVKAILEDALSMIAPRAGECSLTFLDSSLTRFAAGQVHQNVSEENVTFSVRIIDKKRVGSAVASHSSRDALKEAIARALMNAQASPEVEDLAPLPGPGVYEEVPTYDAETGDCTPRMRVACARTMIDEAESRGVDAYGSVETQRCEVAVANTNGLFAYAPLSAASAVLATIGGGAYGYAQCCSRRLSDIDFRAIGSEAATRCLNAKDPVAIDPGRYDVVLLEYAVADILAFLSSLGFGATAVREGRSFVSGAIGKKVMGENITIWDDGTDPSGMPLPFDGEGVPKRKVSLITAGVATGVVYDTQEAAPHRFYHGLDRLFTGLQERVDRHRSRQEHAGRERVPR
jgi:predicted Zn-dependent protease